LRHPRAFWRRFRRPPRPEPVRPGQRPPGAGREPMGSKHSRLCSGRLGREADLCEVADNVRSRRWAVVADRAYGRVRIPQFKQTSALRSVVRLLSAKHRLSTHQLGLGRCRPCCDRAAGKIEAVIQRQVRVESRHVVERARQIRALAVATPFAWKQRNIFGLDRSRPSDGAA
jgi:hypothetical protein